MTLFAMSVMTVISLSLPYHPFVHLTFDEAVTLTLFPIWEPTSLDVLVLIFLLDCVLQKLRFLFSSPFVCLGFPGGPLF